MNLIKETVIINVLELKGIYRQIIQSLPSLLILHIHRYYIYRLYHPCNASISKETKLKFGNYGVVGDRVDLPIKLI